MEKRSRSRASPWPGALRVAPCAARSVRPPDGNGWASTNAVTSSATASSTSHVVPSMTLGISDGLKRCPQTVPVVADERPHRGAVLTVAQRGVARRTDRSERGSHRRLRARRRGARAPRSGSRRANTGSGVACGFAVAPARPTKSSNSSPPPFPAIRLSPMSGALSNRHSSAVFGRLALWLADGRRCGCNCHARSSGCVLRPSAGSGVASADFTLCGGSSQQRLR